MVVVTKTCLDLSLSFFVLHPGSSSKSKKEGTSKDAAGNTVSSKSSKSKSSKSKSPSRSSEPKLGEKSMKVSELENCYHCFVDKGILIVYVDDIILSLPYFSLSLLLAGEVKVKRICI